MSVAVVADRRSGPVVLGRARRRWRCSTTPRAPQRTRATVRYWTTIASSAQRRPMAIRIEGVEARFGLSGGHPPRVVSSLRLPWNAAGHGAASVGA